MSLEKLCAASEVKAGWNAMYVGPILDRDTPPVLVAASKGLNPVATNKSVNSSSRPQESTRKGGPNADVKGSALYFGSSSFVTERDGNSSRYWVRWQDREKNWVEYA